MSDTPETALKRDIVDALLQLVHHPDDVVRLQAGRPRRNVHAAPAGTPDILVVLPSGRTCWLEVKCEGSEPTTVQRARHAHLVGMGHHVGVVRSVRQAVECVLECKAAR